MAAGMQTGIFTSEYPSYNQPPSVWNGYLGGTFEHSYQKTSETGFNINYNCYANPFLNVHIDDGDDTDIVHIYLQHPQQSNLPPMTGIALLRNTTDYVREIRFHPAAGASINDLANDAYYSLFLDAYPSGINDHNFRHVIVLGNRQTGVTHLGAIQVNPHDAVTLDLDEAATGADIISDGVGPNLAIKGIVSGGTTIDTSTNPVVRLTVNVVGSDIVLDLEEVV